MSTQFRDVWAQPEPGLCREENLTLLIAKDDNRSAGSAGLDTKQPLAVEVLLMTIGLQVDLTLDARDLFCPSPVLKAAEEMDKLAPGQLLRILANDPAAEEDIQRWAKRAGHTLVELTKNGHELTFLTRKG